MWRVSLDLFSHLVNCHLADVLLKDISCIRSKKYYNYDECHEDSRIHKHTYAKEITSSHFEAPFTALLRLEAKQDG